jgi:hypothetical protein
MSKIIIQGITQSGKKFRPSDWAERLCGAVASYDRNRRITFHPRVSLAAMDNIKCIVVDASLEQDDDMLYDFLIDFADGNKLKIIRSEYFPPENTP